MSYSPSTPLIKSSLLLSLLFVLVIIVDAATPELFYDWTVSYSKRAPLGVEKQVIVINDQFPGPLLNARTNDVIHVNIYNDLIEPFLMTWNGVQLRKNSWQDGVQGTNCPIHPGQNWTYTFQVKDQIGSYFYFPTLLLQKAAGGYGPIHINNREVIPLPFPQPHADYDILLGDWYNADYQKIRALLDEGGHMPPPDGIVINGKGPNQAVLDFEPGKSYLLRISNVGLKTTVNFRIEDHHLQLVETEGTYTVKQYYNSLDIHVGQSYSVFVRAKQLDPNATAKRYYMVASSRFTLLELFGVGLISYPNSQGYPTEPLPSGPLPFDYNFSLKQALSVRMDLLVGSARPNPQGSYHYGSINVSRTIVLENNLMFEGNKVRYTINGVSFVYSDTPLKLADYFQINDVFQAGVIPDRPNPETPPAFGTAVVDATYHDFYEFVFQNPLPELQTWHLDGYNFFVVGMDHGVWDESSKAKYNLNDAVWRSTVEVYPQSWTAILVPLDNRGMWNLRSQDAEKVYLGQEVYMRVKGKGKEEPWTISPNDEALIPDNAILCGRLIRP